MKFPQPVLPRIVLATMMLLAALVTSHAETATVATPSVPDKPRLLVLTDISNEPDDEESLVRLLVYSNEFEIEGLVATTSVWLRQKVRPELIKHGIEAYGQVRDNLARHAPGFPAAEHLLSLVKASCPEFGMVGVGEGKSTEGSRWLITVVDRPDPRPVWISIWGGANCLAQALRDVREARTPAELDAFVAKLRVYSISDQDDAGSWIRKEFPGVSYIVSPSRQDGMEYWRATWTGISGDRHYKNGPMHKFPLVDNPWIEENIIKNHGPLGALYPKLAYIMEGDTPSFLGLIRNGLGWDLSPAYGGWGGRYVLYQASGETRKIWTNNASSRDTVTADNGVTQTSDPATIWRWREHFQHDFAARMNWCIADAFEKANHNPRPVLNGDATGNVLTLQVKGADEIALSADGTADPDNNAVRVTWWIYPEAGTIEGATLSATEGPATKVRLAAATKPGTLHVILQAEDDGTPHLFAYRRVIIEVTPTAAAPARP